MTTKENDPVAILRAEVRVLARIMKALDTLPLESQSHAIHRAVGAVMVRIKNESHRISPPGSIATDTDEVPQASVGSALNSHLDRDPVERW